MRADRAYRVYRDLHFFLYRISTISCCSSFPLSQIFNPRPPHTKMHPFVLINLHLSLLTLITATTTITTTTNNITSACYGTTLPSLPSSIASENRSIPWGTPSLHLPNGTTCCSSLTQVRDGIDDIDTQLLELLALRAGYVAEATRCKATLDCKSNFLG